MSKEVPNLNEVRASSTRRLADCGIDSAAIDVDQLLMHVLGVEKAGLILAELDHNQLDQFEVLLERRAQREPLQHIIGKAYFRNLALEVGPGVFVPRPETEVLVDLALDLLPQAVAVAPTTPLGSVPTSIVDLCAGSGAIPLAVATELDLASDSLTTPVTVYAVELDDASIEWTRRNTEVLKPTIPAGVQLKVVHADARTAATEELARLRGQVSLVTCNPPYIPDAAIPRDPEVRDYDPEVALYGGEDGLDIVRDIVRTAADLLHPGGVLLIEHGDEQGDAGGELGVPHAVRAHGAFAQVEDHLDLTGRPRVTVAKRI
ncbi:MAG: peptide chain release factor N(5)-glutamine methyltransferase [Candidatus Nanopelagicales bacterium]